MASHVVVIDSAFRRATVKTEPGTILIDILEKGCEKLGLNAEKYILKHNKKVVDMTKTMRQSGLSGGAKLELVQASKSAAPVSVALQLPESLAGGVPGGRLKGTFSSATSFWMLLRKFESDEGRNLNITGRGVAQTQTGMTGAGRIFYEQPVCQVMSRELSTIPDLQKSLASLGFNSGSCLIRLNFKVTSTPLEEAMAEITQYLKSVEEPPTSQAVLQSTAESAATSTEAAQGVIDTEKPQTSAGPELQNIAQEALGSAQESDVPTANDSPMPDATSEPSQEVRDPTPQSSRSQPTAAPLTVLGPNNRKMIVFSAPTNSTPQAALHQSNDSDFEPTLAHVKLHGSRINGDTRNKRLPTAAEEQKLAEEKAAKHAAIAEVEVKVRLPDGTSISALFTNQDTSKDLYDFARGILREGISGEEFILAWMAAKGHRTVPKDGAEKLIVDLGFTGRTLVQFRWSQDASDEVRKGTVLKTQYVEIAQPIHVPNVPSVEEDENEITSKGKGKGIETSSAKKEERKGGVPKWLKLPGKK